MSTEFFNDQWRIPSDENQNKVSNYSMNFDGTSDNIDIGQIDITGTKSVAFWIYPTASGDDGALFTMVPSGGTSDLLSIGLWQSNIQALTELGVKQRSLQTISINTWYHVVVIKATNSITNIYIDGVDQTLDGLGSWNGTPANPQSKIGEATYVADYNFTGNIDQVCVFDYALSATQVSTLYGGGTTVVNPMTLNPKPVAYYQLGDQSADNGANYLSPNGSLQDYVFSFSSSTVTLGSEIVLAQSQTISFWAKFNVVSGTQFAIPISAAAGNWFPLLGVNGSGNFLLYFSSPTNGGVNPGTSTPFLPDVWYNIVSTNDASTLNAYINGVNVYAGGAGSAREDIKISVIGARAIGGFNVNGYMSNVAVWNGTTLSGTEITEIYNNGSPLDLTTFSGTAPSNWYKFNAQDTFDGTNWTIKDYGSGGNDGTSAGMTSANLVQSDLQSTSGYSPYALDFDGVDDYLDFTTTEFLNSGKASFSFWIKPETYSGTNYGYFFSGAAASNTGIAYSEGSSTGSYYPGVLYWFNGSTPIILDVVVTQNVWNHIVIVFDGTSLKTYKDGSLGTTKTITAATTLAYDTIGRYKPTTTHYVNGDISNIAVWGGTALSAAEVTEVYNQGVPSNLNTFSGTAPTVWWQLGSNSSFNTNWTCLDEIGTNNGTSVNMTNDDITNGPGYSANGLGTSSIVIKGDAPYSTSNALSENMDVLDRTTDIPS